MNRHLTDDHVTFRFTAAIAGVVVLVVVAWVLLNADKRLDDGKQDRAALHAKVAAADAQLDDQEAKTALLADQLRELGETPIVSPDSSQPEPSGAPTPAELMLLVREALADFCADGRCTPEDGKDGEPGEPGADSTVPGPQGPAGPAGADGADGKEGRGVKSVECTDDGWVVTYTDDTSENAGQCRPNGPLA